MSDTNNPIPEPAASEALDNLFPEAPLPAQPEPPKSEVFWGWHDFFLFFLITLLALGATMLAATGLRVLFHIAESRMNIIFVLAQFTAYGIAFTCLKLMFRAEYGASLLPSLRWCTTHLHPLRLALLGLGQAVAIAVIGSFMRIPQIDTPMNSLLSDRPTAVVIAILGVTMAPLFEELAFRGLLQPLLIRTIGVFPGILLTSFLFGAMHLEQYGAWQSVVLITMAGVGFGSMRHLTGSTQASAIMHAGYNSALFLLFFTQKGPHS